MEATYLRPTPRRAHRITKVVPPKSLSIKRIDSTRQIEPDAPFSILDFDDPEVRIERDLALEPPLGLGGLDPFGLMHPGEHSLHPGSGLGGHRLGRRRIEGRVSIEAVDFDENGPRFGGAPLAQHRVLPFHAASPQVCGNP